MQTDEATLRKTVAKNIAQYRKAHHDTQLDLATKLNYSDSFNHWNLTDMLSLDRNAFVAPLYGGEIVMPADYARLFGARAIHPHYGQILTHPEIVSRAHEIGIRVHPWTVDDPAAIKALRDLDIDAVITNTPDKALEIMNA